MLQLGCKAFNFEKELIEPAKQAREHMTSYTIVLSPDCHVLTCMENSLVTNRGGFRGGGHWGLMTPPPQELEKKLGGFTCSTVSISLTRGIHVRYSRLFAIVAVSPPSRSHQNHSQTTKFQFFSGGRPQTPLGANVVPHVKYISNFDPPPL